VHAYTASVSENQPSVREFFYEELGSIINMYGKDIQLILLGDFNSKTGSAYKFYKENMGQFGMANTKSNGQFLIDLAHRNNLILTRPTTIFQHKMAHRTTWTCPERINTTRKNPIRNQIDYIICKTGYIRNIKDSRSYNGNELDLDHKLVLAHIGLTTRIKINYMCKEPRNRKVNLNDITTDKTKEYRQIIKNFLMEAYAINYNKCDVITEQDH